MGQLFIWKKCVVHRFAARSQFSSAPIDDNLIKLYAKNYIEKYIDNEILNENEHYIFHLFKDMGYLFKKDKYSFEVTDKMINTLSNTKYATQLIILKNNYDDKVLLNKKYIKSIYERETPFVPGHLTS